MYVKHWEAQMEGATEVQSIVIIIVVYSAE